MITVASGGIKGMPPARPPTAQNVFRKIWQNHMLAASLEGWRPLLWGILDPPLAAIPFVNFPLVLSPDDLTLTQRHATIVIT